VKDADRRGCGNCCQRNEIAAISLGEIRWKVLKKRSNPQALKTEKIEQGANVPIQQSPQRQRRCERRRHGLNFAFVFQLNRS